MSTGTTPGDERADDSGATGELLAQVYHELHKLARQRMRGERVNHTLQPTGLVNEAFLRLSRNGKAKWESRAQFFAAAAEAMRRILIEHARARRGPKRGGKLQRVPIDVVDMAKEADPSQILSMEEALELLEQRDPDAAHVVRLRFYGGLSIEEAAETTGRSARTIKRDWAFARAFLLRTLATE